MYFYTYCTKWHNLCIIYRFQFLLQGNKASSPSRVWKVLHWITYNPFATKHLVHIFMKKRLLHENRSNKVRYYFCLISRGRYQVHTVYLPFQEKKGNTIGVSFGVVLQLINFWFWRKKIAKKFKCELLLQRKDFLFRLQSNIIWAWHLWKIVWILALRGGLLKTCFCAQSCI